MDIATSDESSLLEYRRRCRQRFELQPEDPAVLVAAMRAQRLSQTRAIVARSFRCRSRRRDGLAGEELLHLASTVIAPSLAPDRPRLLRHAIVARTAVVRTLGVQAGVAETDGPLWQAVAALGHWLLKDGSGDPIAIEWQDEGWIRGVLAWAHDRSVMHALVFVD